MTSEPMIPDKPFFWVSEAASVLGVHRSTLYRWLISGKIRCNGFPYHTKISREDLQKILSQLSQPSF
jgi:excisionase family DNA binding protein